MWPDGVGLKNHADIALVNRNESPVFTGKQNLITQVNDTFVGIFQSSNTAERGRLSASTWPQQSIELACFDGKINSSDSGNCAAFNDIAIP